LNQNKNDNQLKGRMQIMCDYRITRHPILDCSEKDKISFYYNEKKLKAKRGEVISTALFANGIKIFGKHHKDNSEQGIFCANGQCAQCLVIANGKSVKSCVTEITKNMRVEPITSTPSLPKDDVIPNEIKEINEYTTEVFIMGGGPAGLSAAIELAKNGLKVIIADDKTMPGGKLGLQTHNFFGSVKDCYAGIRGMDIGAILANKIKKFDNIKIWLNSPVVGVFADKRIGINKNGRYVLVKPNVFLVTAGAREKALAFPGCDLPGIYGAGAFQTLVNRDLVKSAEKLFIVGGGNVGLIAAYHALQAGIDVLGLVEALPECGGYKVHLDKIKRLGVPVWTSHTVIKASGKGKLEKIVIGKVDKNFKVIPGSEVEFKTDTLLIAVGLSPVNEMLINAKEFGIKAYAAGDSDTIAEASAAIFSGKIVGRQILKDMNRKINIPTKWKEIAEILKSRPGKTVELHTPNKGKNKIYPIIRCTQHIPCNPCVDVCIKKSINLIGNSIMGLPEFNGTCIGCGKCVAICPGLAITLIDENYDLVNKKAKVIIPWELPESLLKIGDIHTTTGFEGQILGQGKIIDIKKGEWQNKRKLVHLEVPYSDAQLVAGISARKTVKGHSLKDVKFSDNDIIICRCERVTKKQIIDKIKAGYHDMNQLKSHLRIGMGPCGGKTCLNLIRGIYRECGINPDISVKSQIYRPLELEIPLSALINRGENRS
jgi:sarcosine oxidase, subunit alpha